MSRQSLIVRVLYDFEYATEGGKQVWMREGEKLLLLRKTNLDWWQVIRKGDRRPFYAPASYVEEIPVLQKPSGNSLENGEPPSPDPGRAMTCPKLGDEWEKRRLWAQKEVIAELEKKTSHASTGSSDSSSSVASRILKDLNRTSVSSLPSKPKPAPRTSTTNVKNAAIARANYSKVSIGSCKEPVVENALPRQLSGSLEEMAQQIQFSGANDDDVFDDDIDSRYIYDLPQKPVPMPRKCDVKVPVPLAFANPLYSESDEDVPLNSPHPILPHLPRRGRANSSSHGGETTEDSLPLSDGDTSDNRSAVGSSDDNLVDLPNKGMVPSNSHNADPPATKSPESRQRESSQPPPPPPPEDLLPAPPAFGAEPASPVYANFPLKSPIEPPSPTREAPTKVLANGWEEYAHPSGRVYYYNPDTGEKRWKPPRKNLTGNKQQLSAPESSIEESPSQQCCHPQEDTESTGNYFVVPEEWREDFDDTTGQVFYIHPITGTRWFTSQDGEGRLYFFEENSNESSWTLPEVCVTPSDNAAASPGTSRSEDSTLSKSLTNNSLQDMDSGSLPDHGNNSTNSSKQSTPPRNLVLGSGSRFMKTRSMVVLDSRGELSIADKDILKSSSIPRNQIYLGIEKMRPVKEGQMNRTKITEHGKKLRKNWSSSYVILTDQYLVLFKDAKAYQASQNVTSHAKPELSIDLNGAMIEWTQDKSSRKNVFQVNTLTDLQMLFQVEESDSAHEWYQAILSAIEKLPNGRYSRRRPGSESPQMMELSTPEEGRKFSRLGRSKSTKVKALGSVEDLSNTSENKTKIRARLKKFFYKRPTVESLVKKGIYKDEPVFGCYLHKLCALEKTTVPHFVQECIAVIEGKSENMKADGLYRASGNLSQVQKIRLQVDQGNMTGLEMEEDVHVLTGSLKLFFRELREPLIPFHMFEKALKASSNQNHKEKVHKFREIISALPRPNHDTLHYLLKHLLRVTEYKEWNRMHIPNLAIVFGPTLMWPEHESANLALDMMQQNLVIESLLQEFEAVFR